MSRSRALNRSSRINAKRRRRTLRSAIPSLKDEASRGTQQIDNSQEMIENATKKEALIDLLEPQLFNQV